VSFAKLVALFKEGFQAPPADKPSEHDPLRLATATILLDIAYADGSFTPAEDEDLAEYLVKRFSLLPEDAKELIEAASDLRRNTIDHFAMTNLIRRNASLSERIEIVKTMWRMVYADGKLSDYEGYLVRKLADLLGLEHHVMIDAKVAVLREMETGS
jgi:uncharacterized tellurite resistance protein B-like protein